MAEQSRRVLIVERNPSRDLYKIFFKYDLEDKVQPVYAENLEEAKQKLAEHEFDAVLSEYSFPEKKGGNAKDLGPALLKLVKKHAPEIPVMVNASEVTGGMREELFKLGAMAVHEKSAFAKKVFPLLRKRLLGKKPLEL